MSFDLDAARERFLAFWESATTTWVLGGWAMIPIALIALAMFAFGMHVYMSLRAKRFRAVSEATWRRWIDVPEEREGPIGELLDSVAAAKSLQDAAQAFAHLRMNESAPFDRDLRVMKICVSAAPLVGLLGTVTGMLATFGALSTGSGGDETMGMVARGISEALITTETGLVVALPGLFFQYQVSRTYERYKAFLAHLETVYTQKLYARLRQREMAVTSEPDAAPSSPAVSETKGREHRMDRGLQPLQAR